MMNMKQMVSSNKACTYMVLTALGAAAGVTAGMTAAKMMVDHCCCGQSMKCKAKKALRTVEDKILD